MKRIIYFLFLSVFILQIVSCGLIHSLDPQLEQKIDTWVKNHEYARALDTIKYVGKSHSRYEVLQRKKIDIEKTAKNYESQQLKTIQAQIENQEWQNAERNLNQSLANLPDSAALQLAHQDFIKKRAFHLMNLNCRLSINKAEWLVKNTEVQNELSRTLPDDYATKRAVNAHLEEVKEVYQQLNLCGTEAMNIGDLELAEQCFLLVEELQPGQALQATIADIQQQLAVLQKRNTVVLSEPGRKILNSAKLRMQDGNLKDASNQYNKIPAADKRHALVRAFRQELDTRIKNNVAQGIELGRKLYSQGEVKQALAIWNNILELDANNQHLINYIKRAERVLNKLEKLQEEGTTIKPPEPQGNNS